MWLVVCQDSDPDGPWLAERLALADDVPVELVAASALVHGARWEHRLHAGRPSTVLTLADGRRIDSAAVRGVVNRLLWVGADGFGGASETDREYATTELYALVQSWLHAFGARAINRPAPSGLSGAWRAPCQWRWLARTAGLPVRPYRSGRPAQEGSGDRTVLVLDGRIVDGRDVPDAIAAGCARLARDGGLELMEARFSVRAPDRWEFEDVSLLPGVQAAGDDLARHLAGALRARAAA